MWFLGQDMPDHLTLSKKDKNDAAAEHEQWEKAVHG